MIHLSKYIACICEGSAERAIIKILLDQNRLIFTWDDLLDGEILRCRNAKKFEEQHLRKGFTDRIDSLIKPMAAGRRSFLFPQAAPGKRVFTFCPVKTKETSPLIN